MESIQLPDPSITITVEGEYRIIRSNGLPNHSTGEFPNRGNPNAIRPQKHEFRLPLKPKLSEQLTPSRPEFGIAVNGVTFDAGTAEFWSPDQAGGDARPRRPRQRQPGQDERPRGGPGGGEHGWNYEAIGGSIDLGLDTNNAHVQPTGKYHYHGLPTGLIEQLKAANDAQSMTLIGWAFDGFPVYAPRGHADADVAASQVRSLTSSYRLKDGQRPESPAGPGGKFDGTFTNDWEFVEGAGDLDECNGRSGVTSEFPDGTYYYCITDAFPYIPRQWHGEVGKTFKRRGPWAAPGQGPRTGPGQRTRPGRVP